MSHSEREYVHKFETSHKQDFFSQLNQMRVNNIFTDIILVCKDEEFHAHKLVLSVASPYFKTMIENNVKKSTPIRLDLSDIDMRILKIILNFIYTESKEEILNETFENLLRVHAYSHFYRVQNLKKLSWKIINERINANNWLLVWKEAIKCRDLSYIQTLIETFLKLFQNINQEEFLNLEMTEIKTLIDNILDKSAKNEERLLEAIAKWIKTDMGRLRFLGDLILGINFDSISITKIKKVLFDLDEDSCYENEFFELFLQLQITPKEKLRHALQDILETFQSDETLPSVNFFYFGNYKNYSTDGKLNKEYSALWIIDPQNKSHVKLQFLPFKVHNKMLYVNCPNCNYKFYFLDPSNCIDHRKHRFFSYNWRANEVIYEPLPPEVTEDSHMCILGNKIYLIGVDSLGYLVISCFEINKQEWEVIEIEKYEVTEICAAVTMKNQIYFFASLLEDFSGLSLYCVNNNSCYNILKSDNYEQDDTNSRMITVYKSDIFRFCQLETYSYYVHKSNGQYKLYMNNCLKDVPLECCFSTESEGIFFYNKNNEILYFERDTDHIKKLPYHYPFKGSCQTIDDKQFTFSYDIFIVCNCQEL